jgi:hypothetical protein
MLSPSNNILFNYFLYVENLINDQFHVSVFLFAQSVCDRFNRVFYLFVAFQIRLGHRKVFRQFTIGLPHQFVF